MADRVAALCKEPVQPVYLITGAEGLLVRRAVERLVERVQPDCEPASFNVTYARCGDGDVTTALSAARTLPMMASRRLVVVRDLHEGDNTFFSALQEYVEQPPDSTTLILAGEGFPKVRKGGKNWGSRIKNRVKKAGTVLAFSSRDADPRQIAVERAEALGHALHRDDAGLLADLVGGDLSRVVREVDKASLYVDEGAPITSEAIHAACSVSAEAEVWDLTAAIAARDAGAALGSLHRLLEGGEPPHRLLGLIAWQLRSVLQLADMLRRRRPEREIRKAVRMRFDTYRAVKRRIEARGVPGAASVMEQLAATNRAMNRSRIGDRREIERLVLSLTTR